MFNKPITTKVFGIELDSQFYFIKKSNKLTFDWNWKDNGLDKLSSIDFNSLSNLIDEYVIDFDAIADKKTFALRSWIQNQANKFLCKFHNEKKDKLTLA